MKTLEFHNRQELVDGFRVALDASADVLLRSTLETNPVLAFARSVVAGLNGATPSLDCRFMYDTRGSALYEQICEQPEYYLTRAEDEILARCGTALRELTGPVRLLELGSGNAVKTDHLLAAWLGRADSAAYVPVDVSVSALRKAEATIAARYEGVKFVGVNSTYQQAFPLLEEASPVMAMFMGSTIGNLDDDHADIFWRQMSRALRPGDFFLLGIDLIKDHDRLEAAYNDAAGVTAKFTLNLFERMNRELGCDIDTSTLSHEARYNEHFERIETYVCFHEAQTFEVVPLDHVIHLNAGARVLVEISRKFNRVRMVEELRRFGLEHVADYSDDGGHFALLLLRRAVGING